MDIINSSDSVNVSWEGRDSEGNLESGDKEIEKISLFRKIANGNFSLFFIKSPVLLVQLVLVSVWYRVHITVMFLNTVCKLN